jgi:broad specificity phosphatase PhoE
MKNILLILLLAIGMISCGPQIEPKTIYVVRHAEKILNGEDDPLLSVAGTVRAKKLAQIMSTREISHLFSTNFRRTRGTLQFLAEQQQLTIEDYDVKNHDALVDQLKSRKGNIVVVGHSNTLHHIVNYFIGDGEPYGELGDIEYDFIYEIHLDKNGKSKVERRVYKEY